MLVQIPLCNISRNYSQKSIPKIATCYFLIHYFTASFYKAWTQVLCRFKSWSRAGDSRWCGSLTMIPAGNKAKRLSLVNHTKKIIIIIIIIIIKEKQKCFASEAVFSCKMLLTCLVTCFLFEKLVLRIYFKLVISFVLALRLCLQ